MPTKKRGRLLLIGNDLDAQVQLYLNELRKRGGVVNTEATIAVGKGMPNFSLSMVEPSP